MENTTSVINEVQSQDTLTTLFSVHLLAYALFNILSNLIFLLHTVSTKKLSNSHLS